MTCYITQGSFMLEFGEMLQSNWLLLVLPVLCNFFGIWYMAWPKSATTTSYTCLIIKTLSWLHNCILQIRWYSTTFVVQIFLGTGCHSMVAPTVAWMFTFLQLFAWDSEWQRLHILLVRFWHIHFLEEQHIVIAPEQKLSENFEGVHVIQK